MMKVNLIPLCSVFIITTLLLSCQLLNQGQMHHQKRNEAAMYNTQLGLAYLKEGDRVRAKRKLLTALELSPDSPDVNAGMAYFLEKSGDLQNAEIYYQKALSVAPSNGAQLNNYGAFLCRQGKYKAAEHCFLKAVKDIHYLHTAGAYENAGLCSASIPDYVKAKYYFEKALAQDPQQEKIREELAAIKLKQK